MPVKIMLTNQGAKPVILCDACGARIETAKEGNYEWDGDAIRSGTLHQVYFIHKACSATHERQYGKPLDSMDLDVLLPYLANNLKVDWSEANRRAAYFSEPLG